MFKFSLLLCLVVVNGYHNRELKPIGCTVEGADWCKYNPVQGVLSYDVNRDPTSSAFDMFINLFSTLGGPSMLQLHFDSESDWGGFAEPTSGSDAGYSGHSGQFFLGLTFPKIIEFEDTNGDLRYDSGDTITAEHSISGEPGTNVYAEWGGFNYDKIRVGAAEVMTWSATWKGSATIPKGAISIRFRTTDQEVTLDDGIHLNPNRTKLDFTLNKFPKQSATSLLALEGWLASATNQQSTSVPKEGEEAQNSVHYGDDGFIKWDTESEVAVNAGTKSVTIRVSAYEDMQGTDGDGTNSEFWKHVNNFKAQIDSSYSVKRTYFTYSTGGRPTDSVYWDPIIQYGPDIPAGGGTVAGIVMGAIVAIVILLGIGYYLHRKCQDKSDFANIPDAEVGYANRPDDHSPLNKNYGTSKHQTKPQM